MEENNKEAAVIDITVENKYPNDQKSCSSVHSESVESFSTIHDSETVYNPHYENYDTDLIVHIDQPQKQTETLETYISYRITTKVTRNEYQQNEFVVKRRYNDFNWLRQRLIETYPTLIVPPLPAKHTLLGQLDRYSKEFILERMNLLNFFTSRIVSHPILSYDQNLKVFLTARQSDFIAYRKNRNVISKMTDSIQNISSNHTLKYRIAEFEKFKEYSSNLYDKLTAIEKISSRINKEQKEYLIELNNYHSVLWTWSRSEPHFSSLLIKISKAFEQITKAQHCLNSKHNIMAYPLREIILDIEGVKEALTRRDSYQYAYEHSVDDLAKKRAEKDHLMSINQSNEPQANSHFAIWSPSNDQRLERLGKLGTAIPPLIKQTENLQDRLECANNALRSDLERWQIEKEKILKRVLLSFAKKQLDYYQNCVDTWEQVLNSNVVTAQDPESKNNSDSSSPNCINDSTSSNSLLNDARELNMMNN